MVGCVMKRGESWKSVLLEETIFTSLMDDDAVDNAGDIKDVKICDLNIDKNPTSF